MASDVAVVGANGFVGRAAVTALTAAGHSVRGVRAPRLREPGSDAREIGRRAGTSTAIGPLAQELAGCHVVVNAAGSATPESSDWSRIAGANSLLPGIIAAAAAVAGLRRIIHVSSMAVQGRVELLDESATYASFSPYSCSKQLGEQVLLAWDGPVEVVILRPGSVHGPDRPVTRTLAEFARSRLSSVAGSGQQPSPQHLVQHVAGAAAFLVTAADPPSIVLQPWAGVTTASLLRDLGGKEPRHVPCPVARAALSLAAAGRTGPRSQAWARRLELLWFGQRQAVGYLDRSTFRPEHRRHEWAALARAV